MWVSYHYAVEAFKRQTPRVVVLEGFGLCYGTTYMTPADVDGTSDDYSLRIPPSLNRAALAVAMSRCQQNSPPFYRYLPMLRYHTRWKSLKAEDFTWFFQDHATTGKGYGPLQTVEEFPVPILEGEPEETPIYPQAEEYLYKLIALCRKKDVPLVFVVTPYETSGAEYGVFRRAARICAENGVPVLDYNAPGGRDIGFDYATDLADHAHVNTAGAQKISTDLAAYLAEHYGMPDKRGDAAYAAWDEAARMEHRDAQNITLRFTLDMAEYFRLLCRIRTWQRSSRHRATPRKRIPPLRAQCSGNGGWTRCRWNKAACRAYMWWTAEKSCTRRPAPARWNTRFPGAGTM